MTDGSLGGVEAYLQALSRVRDVVRRSFPGVEGLVGLFHLYRSKQLRKSGTIFDGLKYEFHGSGCLFVEADGTEVDVDFLQEGVEVFDAWRVERFLLSLQKEKEWSLADIAAACHSFVSQGRLTELRAGWFSTAAGDIQTR